MKGWEVTKLGEVCRLINGRAYNQKELLSSGPTPVLRVGNFFTNKNWYYSDLELENEKYCDDGDLLYAWSASFGPRIWAGGRVIYHYHIWKVEPDARRVDTRFLFHFLDWDKDRIKAEQGAGTTMTHVTKGSMEARRLRLPPLPEQRRIVAILDEAFAGLEAMRANAEKNLQNARELFESYLNTVFTQNCEGTVEMTLRRVSKDFGRGKSKHRPRNDPKLYGGKYPFIQTGDVRNCDHIIMTSTQTYNEDGLEQSKLWPKGTICITIAANIAETGILGFDACFPDSVIGIVVDKSKTTNEFVEYLLQSMKAHLKAQGKGSAQDNINLGTFENHPFPFPDLTRQRQIVANLNLLSEHTGSLESLSRKKLAAIAELKQSILQKAFSGQLTTEAAQPVTNGTAIHRDACDANRNTALVLALAFERHKRAGRDKTFGHVKAQKILHMVEARADFDLGRKPIKDAAGPNDFPHMLAAEKWAEARKHFRFPEKSEGGYRFEPMVNYGELLDSARLIDRDTREKIERVIELIVPMDTQSAELFATVYAAWNNLLLEGADPTNDEIIRAAREDWHEDKNKISRHKFIDALRLLRVKDCVPTGRGRKVEDAPQGSLFK